MADTLTPLGRLEADITTALTALRQARTLHSHAPTGDNTARLARATTRLDALTDQLRAAIEAD